MTEDTIVDKDDAKKGADTKDDTSQDTDKKPQKHEPPVGSERWNEIYWKSKEYDRVKGDMDAMKEHNKALADAVANMQDGFLDLKKPDKETDPDGYEKWLIEKGKQEAIKATRPKEPVKPQQPVSQTEQIDPYEIAMITQHDDYYSVVAWTMKDMKKNAVFNNEVLSMPPDKRYKYAYEYGTERMQKYYKQKENAVDQGYVESGGLPPVSKKIELTAEQKRVAKKLGVSEEKYLAQVKFIQEGKGE